MIKKGDLVKIKPEYQDEGDSLYKWVAIDNEEKNRVLISPIDIDMSIIPVCTVTINMLEKFKI